MRFHLKTALALGVMLTASSAFAQPAGSIAPATVQPEDDEGLRYSASVGQVDALTHQGDNSVKLFSTVGDTAINGVYLFLSFDFSPQENARIFKVGDVGDYRIVSETPGRLLLAVTEDGLRGGGEVYQTRRRVLITWTPGAGGTAPARVTVRTARAR